MRLAGKVKEGVGIGVHDGSRVALGNEVELGCCVGLADKVGFGVTLGVRLGIRLSEGFTVAGKVSVGELLCNK